MGFLFALTPELVPDDQTLPGRAEPLLPNPQPHAVLGTPITGPWKPEQRRLRIAIGCFWGVEKMFWELDGVESTSAGYAGGQTPNPTYAEVCGGRTNHAETVEVVYDPETISLKDLVRTALEAHDPTQGYRQGNDHGTQYRSAFYPDTEEEAEQIRQWCDEYGRQLKEAGYGDMTTEVRADVDYYLAEEQHQQYLHKVPNGYCPHHSTGVACGI
ncbi:peptide-methionine (S)-S-oxide reductase [Corynebacterium sp. NML 150383]|uniref:peptide-methionine (S)-S-oxide reductase MsrA n=1 Tax=Corynebacterium TaxID=1716 RepID=UPI000BAA593B|nr:MULTISPECIES: peptide-methionine (S)-S-oxide reductase MsrA [Corynebacterium]MCG7254996.1 peptide-methionine (S)-S-oxide reductase MsrA [Corynebacterium hadale]MCG7257203.1 peptide-methionine (S)-S-oxide reductase MsrA [Corynebacterium hadale]MCG7265903.1 peptide-methionine (S)-S-oxide reductase MsrA [Corynebacterium hadale]PAT03238.1 peptide-methionine (S)-S-oxide reductase [Corynebacterium sp. NML 150383]PAT15821.1 peptide-methionine (S)-S-oxide reductase [Corynebacterium sp. NML 120412]